MIHLGTRAINTVILLSGVVAICTNFLLTSTALGAIEHRNFSSEQHRVLYHELIRELRCLVCQNQNLAESDADLAKDLRDKTYSLINDGQDRSAIVDYMVERYGDFVLYRPPFKANTAALWLGPLFLMIIGLLVFFRISRQRTDESAPAATNSASLPGVDVATARRLLEDIKPDSPTSDQSDSTLDRTPGQ